MAESNSGTDSIIKLTDLTVCDEFLLCILRQRVITLQDLGFRILIENKIEV